MEISSPPKVNGFIETDKMERQNLEAYGRKNQGDITGNILVCSEQFEVQHFASDKQNIDLDQGEQKTKKGRVYIRSTFSLSGDS